MIVEYIRYTVEPDRSAAFEQAYADAEAPLRESGQCHAIEVARCSEDPSQYVVRLEWESAEAHLDGFRSGPQFPRFFALVRPFFPGIAEMRHYEVRSSAQLA